MAKFLKLNFITTKNLILNYLVSFGPRVSKFDSQILTYFLLTSHLCPKCLNYRHIFWSIFFFLLNYILAGSGELIVVCVNSLCNNRLLQIIYHTLLPKYKGASYQK